MSSDRRPCSLLAVLPSLHPFSLKALPADGVHGSLGLLSFVLTARPWADRAKNGGRTNPASIHLHSHHLYSSHCLLSPQRLLQKWGYNCVPPPPSHLHLMPGSARGLSRSGGGSASASGADVWSVASRGRILRSI